jgi:cell division transport system permease protein
MRAIGYAFDEAVGSLWRGRQSGLLSTGTIAIALFVLGAFLLITSNLQRLGDEWSRAAELSVYLKDDASAADRTRVERLLVPGEVVASFEFVSQADALTRFKQTFADLAATAETVGDSPLPASYEVRLQPSNRAQTGVDGLAAALRKTAGVSDVRYDREWLDRLLSAVGVIRSAGLILGIGLTLAAALTVANVVRLALHARRDEIEIMHLVGAPTTFVRGPFVMEGVLQGGAGALVALAVLAAVFIGVRGRFLAPLAAAINLSSVRFLPLELCAGLLVGGMLVGCLGGVIAANGRA